MNDFDISVTGSHHVDLYTKGHEGDINYMQTPFQEWLRKFNACGSARRWVGSQRLQDVYRRMQDPTAPTAPEGYVDWFFSILDQDTQLCTCLRYDSGSSEAEREAAWQRCPLRLTTQERYAELLATFPLSRLYELTGLPEGA